MKKRFMLLLVASLALILVAGCSKDESKTTADQKPAAEKAAAPATASAAGKSGTVIETIDAAGYTYVQVDTGTEKFWAAAPQFAAKAGDPVIVPEGMPMENYHSKSLDRTFDVVYFVDSVVVGGAQSASASAGAMPEGHPAIDNPATTPAAATVDLTNIKKAGKTVAEIFAEKDQLNGKAVEVRGKVVKYSPEIMGKNWIHIQDGTGGEGTNDLTVTTSAQAAQGDTVVVSGQVTTNKDFGYGYKYDVIIEDATVKAE